MVSGTDTTAVPPHPDDLPRDPQASYRPPSKAGSAPGAFDPTIASGVSAQAHSESAARDRAPAAYLLRRSVGSGTFGEVWEAVQVTLKRVVAVKRPRRDRADPSSEESRQAEVEFLKEALTAGRLDHPNIVPVYDLGADEQGRPLLAMKLIDGERWDTILAQEPRSGHDFLVRHVTILLKIARAVAFAHARGVIHRDLKPHQVMVGRFGEAFLMDWGLAVALPVSPGASSAAAGFATPMAEAASPAGTTAFMAPEQTEATAERLGVWTDVYLLGGTLFYILTGKPPHAQPNSWEAFQHAARGVVEPPEDVASGNDVPLELSALCMKALSRVPFDRPASAQEFAQDLENWLTGAAARAEARQLAAEAPPLLKQSAPSYAVLDHADALLSRALLLWPDSRDATALQRTMLETYVQAALANNDLSLAAVQAERVPDPVRRDALTARVAASLRRARRQSRQRRVAIYAGFFLFTGVFFLALLIARNSAEALVTESDLMAHGAERDMLRVLARQKAAHETRRADLLGRMAALRAATGEFIDMAGRELLPPTSLSHDKDWSTVWLGSRPELPGELKARLAEIAALRLSLSVDRIPIESEPAEVVFARGILHLYDNGTTSCRAAYDDFSRAAALMPDRHTGHLAAGVAAARLREYTSATASLQKAVQLVGFSDQQAHHTAVTMLSALNRQRWADVKLPGDSLLIESWPTGRNFDRYAEIEGAWTDSQHTATYKSTAPGLTPSERCGTRRLAFYEPFRTVAPAVPARARFTPRWDSTRRRHVYVTWPGEANASPVYYRVRHNGGEVVIPLVQNGTGSGAEPNGDAWIHLGEFEFAPGPDHYVEVSVGDDVRPLAPERYGQVSVDAVLFTSQPVGQGTRPATQARDASPDGPVLCAAPTTSAGAEQPRWIASPHEAQAEAKRLGRPLFLYAWYPADSCFVHPLNQNRDYCENRLLAHPAVASLLRERFVSGKVDLSLHPDAGAFYGLSPSGASISVIDPASSSPLKLELRGADLLLSPAALEAKLTAVSGPR